MRTVRFSARQARILRENLANAQKEGYDEVDLRKLDKLSEKLIVLQGSYAERMAELKREEGKARKQFIKAESPASKDEADRQLALMTFEVQDLHEAAEGTPVEFQVSEGEWKLIRDKIDSVERWTGADEYRALVIGILDAVRNAESDESDEAVEDETGKVIKLKRR